MENDQQYPFRIHPTSFHYMLTILFLAGIIASISFAVETTPIEDSLFNFPISDYRNYTKEELAKVFAVWANARNSNMPSAEEMEKEYSQLGDGSYAVREKATVEFLQMGPTILGFLNQRLQNEKDTEIQIRIKHIVENITTHRIMRLNNLVEAWKHLAREEQLRYAVSVADALLEMPEQIEIPAPEPGDRLDYFEKRLGPRTTIWSRNRLLFDVVSSVAAQSTTEAYQILAQFLSKRDKALILRAMECVGTPRASVDVAPRLLELAQGNDKDIALKALDHLSNWHDTNVHRQEITIALKRLYKHPDPEIALEAAIVSCYSGDRSGFPLWLEATMSDNKAVRIKAVAQLVDDRVVDSADVVVPYLIAQLGVTDLELLERAIESLGSYKGNAKHIIRFLHHPSKEIVLRTILSLEMMPDAEAVKALKMLLKESNDAVIRRNVKEALVYIQKGTL
jgi:hypothetical protein